MRLVEAIFPAMGIKIANLVVSMECFGALRLDTSKAVEPGSGTWKPKKPPKKH
jgi:hypothetical protein